MNNLLQKEYHFGFSALLRTELWLAGGLKLLLITLGAGIIVPFLPTAFCVLYRFGLLVFLMVLPQVASIRAVRSEDVLICFLGEMKPFVVKNPKDDSVVELITPMRTF